MLKLLGCSTFFEQCEGTSRSHKFKFQHFKGKKKRLVRYLLTTMCILQCDDQQHQAYSSTCNLKPKVALQVMYRLNFVTSPCYQYDNTSTHTTPIAVASTDVWPHLKNSVQTYFSGPLHHPCVKSSLRY